MPHHARGGHRRGHPVHLTMRLRRGLGSLRAPRAFAAISAAIAAASSEVFRVLQFTVQDNHLHLMIEAEGRRELMAGTKGLAVRSARALNRALRRRGQVWGDRYHTRELSTPREVRDCYAYISSTGGSIGRGPPDSMPARQRFGSTAGSGGPKARRRGAMVSRRWLAHGPGWPAWGGAVAGS